MISCNKKYYFHVVFGYVQRENLLVLSKKSKLFLPSCEVFLIAGGMDFFPSLLPSLSLFFTIYFGFRLVFLPYRQVTVVLFPPPLSITVDWLSPLFSVILQSWLLRTMGEPSPWPFKARSNLLHMPWPSMHPASVSTYP